MCRCFRYCSSGESSYTHLSPPRSRARGLVGIPSHLLISPGRDPVHPGYAAAGAIRMGRHRGLPLHRNASASGLPRYPQVAQPRERSGWADTGVCLYTGTRPRRDYRGTPRLRSRGSDPDRQTQGSAPTPERARVGITAVRPGCAAAGAIRIGRHRGLPLHRNASAWGLSRSVQVTQPRRSSPGACRLRNRVGVAEVDPGYAATGAIRMGRHRGLPLHRNASAWGLLRSVQVTQPRRGCPGACRLRRAGANPFLRRPCPVHYDLPGNSFA
jgi:hypothetical protein